MPADEAIAVLPRKSLNTNRVRELKKVKIVSSEHIVNVTGHRGINFLNDYDEADEEELR